MSVKTACRVCLADNLNLYDIGKDLQNAYETLTREKFNKVGYPVCMCYICLSVLRKCHRLMETARDTNRLLKQCYNQQNEMRVAKPLFTYALSKVELVSTNNKHVSSELEIKTETKAEQLAGDIKLVVCRGWEFILCSTGSQTDGICQPRQTTARPQDTISVFCRGLTSTQTVWRTDDLCGCNDTIDLTGKQGPSGALNDRNFTDGKSKAQIKNDYTECDIDVDTETTGTDEQTGHSTTLVDSSINTNDDKQADPLLNNNMDNEWSGSEVISQHNNSNSQGCEGIEMTEVDQVNEINDEMQLPSANEAPREFDIEIKVEEINESDADNLFTDDESHAENLSTINLPCENLNPKNSKTEKRSKRRRRYVICDICDQSCTSTCSLRRHIIKNHPSTIKINTKKKLNQKMKTYSCNECSYSSIKKILLIRHLRIHFGEKPISCGICEYKCSVKSSLTMHMRTHTGERPFLCNICEYKGTQKSHLTRHMRTHTGERPFLCNICEYKGSQQYNLTKHMRTHIGGRLFSCDICRSKFARKSSFTKHMRTHTGERPFSCDICRYKCAKKTVLTTHMRTHTGERPFSCNICRYKCARKSQLTSHIKRTHTGERPFSCDICRYKCAQKSDLTKHMSTHTGERPFSCHICRSKFARKSILTKHMRTHTGERPFSCDICKYKCAQKSNLINHMRTHTGETPFLCNICDYKGKQKFSLTTHMRTHTGEKPFSCNICEYKCTKMRYLKEHLLTKHVNKKQK